MISNLPSPPSFLTRKNKKEPSLVAHTTTNDVITISLKYISGIAIRVKIEAEIKVNDPVKSKNVLFC